jgi:hypothetical protein
MPEPRETVPPLRLKRDTGPRAQLDALHWGGQQQTLDFKRLKDGLGRRAFGMLVAWWQESSSLPPPLPCQADF